MVRLFCDQDIPQVINLWNRSAVSDGYKEMDEERFRQIFLNSPGYAPDLLYVLEETEIRGFVCGAIGEKLPRGDISGYVTCVVLDTSYQSTASYGLLLSKLEDAFLIRKKIQSEVLFFNPMHLPWYIPGTPRHEHDNAPGAPVDTACYKAMLENGYIERTRECAMYRDLKGFEIPKEIAQKQAAAARAGYRTELLAPCHTGIQTMLDALGNPLWKQEILRSEEIGLPVVLAVLECKAVGFAGPIVRQPSGRGYFAGIGVMPEHEGHGLGTLLFFKLCEELKKNGADYMSLYTGLENPAKKIYEKAGFRKVREFGILRKMIG